MAKAYITRHSIARREFAALSTGDPISAIGAHIGDSIDLDFTSGEASTIPLEVGLYEIFISGADARLKIDEDEPATQQNGQYWADGRCSLRFVRKGQKISVIAAA